WGKARSRLRCMGACLLPEISKPARGLSKGVLERGELDGSLEILRRGEEITALLKACLKNGSRRGHEADGCALGQEIRLVTSAATIHLISARARRWSRVGVWLPHSQV